MSVIKFDYYSLKERVLKRLSANEEWQEFLSYSVVDGLISAIFTEIAYDIGYTEKNEVENFWSKARNKSSLLVQSSVHGYKCRRKQGCNGTLRLSTSKTFNETFAKEIIIPKFSQFSGGGFYFCTSKSYRLTPDKEYIDFNVIQGEKNEIEFVASGNQFETKFINDNSIENNVFEVLVNNVEWKEVTSLFDQDKDSQVYTLNLKPDCSGVTVKFGNNIYGKKLENGDVVKITYLSTKGSECNIPQSDVVTKCEDVFYDPNANPITCYVTNITPMSGGKDYPTIEEIREMSPKVFQTGDRASSIDDYSTMVKNLTDISKINVWGAYEVLKDQNKSPFEFLPSEENVIHIAALNSSYEKLTTEIKYDIVEQLHLKCDPTDLISFDEVYTNPIKIIVDATLLNESYSLSEIKANIINELTEKYKISNRNFYESINLSDIIALVDNIKGIDYCTCSYIAYYISTLTTPTSFEETLPFEKLNDMSKTKIYIRDISNNEDWNLLATVNKYGVIIGQLENIPVTGQIDIINNKVSMIIRDLQEDFSNYELKFEVDVNANKLRQTIWYFGDSEISLNYQVNE